MKYLLRINTLLTFTVLLLLSENIVSAQEFNFTADGNPFVKHMYTADPSARVFNNRLYVYTSHDEDTATYFNMIDWHVFSTDNMKDWVDHGPIFSLNDISWATKWAWAPDCIERNGKYYFYYPVERTKIGVAVGNTPTGPFTDELGKPLVDNTGLPEKVGPEPIDPAIFIEDGNAYMYFGCREFRTVKLKENMMEIEGDIFEIEITNNDGDIEGERGYYGEGPWVFKRRDIYYLVYANGWAPASTMVYAISDNPLGPFEYVGEVMSPVDSYTSHGSLVEFKGKWYIFYHNMNLSNHNNRRSICFDEITFDAEGKINRLEVKK